MPPHHSEATVPPAKFLADIRSFAMRLAVGVVCVNVILICLSLLLVQQSRQDNESQAKVTAQNLARILEHDIANIINKVDITLLAVADEVEQQAEHGGLDKPILNAFMARQLSHVPEFNNLFVTNATGDIIFGTLPLSDKIINIASRDYFKIHKNKATSGLYISKPLISQFSNKWLIVAARRVNRPDGSFRGVVMTALTFDYFTKLFASQNIGAHGGISLRDAEMGIITRYPAPADPSTIIGNKTLSPELRTLFETGNSEGTFYTPSSWDNTAKIVSYRKISSYPLYINVGLATSDYLAAWRLNTSHILMLLSLYILVTFFLARGLFIRYRREKLAEQASAESEQRFQSMANTAPVMLWVVGPDKQCVWVNNAWLVFAGSTLAEELKKDWTVGIHPDDLYLCLKLYADAFAARKPFQMEYRMRRADGQYRWVVDHGAPRYDESGNFAGYIGSCIDISDTKQYQFQLKSLASELALTQERERRQIAIDLHDYVVQDLALARIKLNLIQRSAVSSELQQVTDIIDSTISKLRSLLFDLSSSALYELGLVAALEDLGKRLGSEHGFSFVLTVNPEQLTLMETTKITLYQIIRELLLNTAKHSHADHVKLAIFHNATAIKLSVMDNGCGFDVEAQTLEASTKSSFGLFSIRQRLTHLGGTFTIDSSASTGTCASLSIPYQKPTDMTGD